MTRVDFTLLQLPVGQGGFHAGWLEIRKPSKHTGRFNGGPKFLWVYDCGSDQLTSLKREIRKFQDVHINMLFLSHLDDDHISGVDTLLHTASQVDEVVLPYLGETDWALHLAASAVSGSLSGNIIDLAADPAEWFGSRGVKRITYIRTGEEGEDAPSAPDSIDPSEPDLERPKDHAESEESPIIRKWTGSSQAATAGTEGGKRAEVFIASRGSVASTQITGGTLNWLLSPFAFGPSAIKLATFQKMLDGEFGNGLTAKSYANRARTSAGRKKLRLCYNAVWKTHNLHSMALYTGPAIPAASKRSNTAWQGNLLRRVVQPGWVSTGDFDFSVKKRRDQLITYYSPYSGMVGQLTLSHHGSDLSFHPAVLSAYPDLTFAVASVGANSYGHPGLGTQAAVNAVPRVAFSRVDESATSLFKVTGQVKS